MEEEKEQRVIKIKEKTFLSSNEEVIYYKLKYTKFKGKYLSLLETNTELLSNKAILIKEIEQLKSELKSEKLLRKTYQQKVDNFLKTERSAFNQYAPIVVSSLIDNNISKQKTKEFFDDDSDHNTSLDKNSRINNNICLDNDNDNNNDNQFPLSNTDPINNNHPSDEINQNTVYKQMNLNNDSNLGSSSLKQKNDREMTNKFDIDIVSKSLKIDFLDYDRDSISQRRKLKIKEDKIAKLEKIIKAWVNISDTLKKGINTMTTSLIAFNDNLLNDQIEIFDECPDLISLIYILQSNLTDVISQFKFIGCSIENSFTSQLQSFLSHTLDELYECKQSLNKHVEDFNYCSAKFLSLKKNNVKESQKENYIMQYKLLEYTRYDYITKINSTLLYIKVELPEKIALLIYSFISLFRQGNELLLKTEPTINDNLEKIAVKYKEKERIIEEMKMNKKVLADNFDKANINIASKEGFLFIKMKDGNTYFKRRYIKFQNGNLIYFKLKKGVTDIIDTSKHFELCNLLLCNVKKNDKDYDYPFCFEVISANIKKSYIFQAEMQKEADEWIAAIRNAISNQISNYQDHPIEQNQHDSFHDIKENAVDKIISNTKCSDCNSDNPTWLSINWLCMICIDCSSIHRSLGVKISKCKSLQLDNLDPDYIDLIETIGQEKITGILESNVKSYEKPKPNSMFTEKEIFITNKYKHKKYIKAIPSKNKEENIQKVFQFIEANDLINIYYYLIQEICDINQLYSYKKEKCTLLHHAAKIGKINPFKLLITLGADFTLIDINNLKPMDYATIYKNSEIADYIVRKIEEIK